MTDHVDWAARFLEQTLRHQAQEDDHLEIPADYPWVGLALSMFAELRTRGFDMTRRDVTKCRECEHPVHDGVCHMVKTTDIFEGGMVVDTMITGPCRCGVRMTP